MRSFTFLLPRSKAFSTTSRKYQVVSRQLMTVSAMSVSAKVWLLNVMLFLIQVVASATTATSFVIERIRFCKFMTAFAMRGSVKSLILSVSHSLKMAYFETISRFANVVNFKPFRDFTVLLLPSKSMNEFEFFGGFVPNLGVAITHDRSLLESARFQKVSHEQYCNTVGRV